jgi:glycosyltransferase involved in cell wall biosynthesis
VSELREQQDVRLSIVVASSGRPTLGAALASATSQMLPGDELILVFDDSGDAGDTPRNRVLDSATGTHITFLDDDDAYRPGALEAIRRFGREHPGRIGIFKIDLGMWGVAWHPAHKRLIATATAMYVIPNVPGRVGRFGRAPGAKTGRLGDFKFIVETVAMQDEPIWCDEVIQDIRPIRSPLLRLRYRLRLRTRLRERLRGAPPLQSSLPGYPEAEEWAKARQEEIRRELALLERDRA